MINKMLLSSRKEAGKGWFYPSPSTGGSNPPTDSSHLFPVNGFFKNHSEGSHIGQTIRKFNDIYGTKVHLYLVQFNSDGSYEYSCSIKSMIPADHEEFVALKVDSNGYPIIRSARRLILANYGEQRVYIKFEDGKEPILLTKGQTIDKKWEILGHLNNSDNPVGDTWKFTLQVRRSIES